MCVLERGANGIQPLCSERIREQAGLTLVKKLVQRTCMKGVVEKSDRSRSTDHSTNGGLYNHC
jgi:hypothetical protein